MSDFSFIPKYRLPQTSFPIIINRDFSTSSVNRARLARKIIDDNLSSLLRERMKQGIRTRYQLIYPPMIKCDDIEVFKALDDSMIEIQEYIVRVVEYLLVDFRMSIRIFAQITGFMTRKGSPFLEKMEIDGPFLDSRINVSAGRSFNKNHFIYFHGDSLQKLGEVRSSPFKSFSNMITILMGYIDSEYRKDTGKGVMASSKALFEIINKIIGNKHLFLIKSQIDGINEYIESLTEDHEFMVHTRIKARECVMERYRGMVSDFIDKSPFNSDSLQEIKKQWAETWAQEIHDL